MSRLHRQDLEKPFDQVKFREGNNGKQLAYLEGHQVVRRMADVLDNAYDFEVVRWEVVGNDVIVQGAVTVRLSDGTVVRKENVGSAEIHLDKTTGAQQDIGDAFKAAVTDTFKRVCAFGFGVGLYLYTGDEPVLPAKPTPVAAPPRDSLSQAQRNAILAIGKAKGLGPRDLAEMARRNFACAIDELSKADASRFIQALQTIEARKAG